MIRMIRRNHLSSALGIALLLTLTSSLASAIPSISRKEIIDIAISGVGCPYVWGGTCWDPANKSWKGPDCSGYVTKCWQIPTATPTTDCVPHVYTTKTYLNTTTHWTKISRDDLIQGDALVYNDGSHGHIIIYDSGDKWGAAQVYEARGSAYGVVHRTKTVESKYAARRRDSLAAATPTYPLMSITSSAETILGQDRDFCKQGASSGIFDVIVGQTVKVNIDIQNTGTAKALDVQVGVSVEDPYLHIGHWNIYTNWKSASFILNDADGFQSFPHDNPGNDLTFKLTASSPGETKRITLIVQASRFSGSAAEHPHIRAWISKVKDFYDKSTYDATPTNVNSYQTQNGGDLRAALETDVFGPEVCDDKDNDCDGKVDEDNICHDPKTGDGGTPAGDALAGQDAGGTHDVEQIEDPDEKDFPKPAPRPDPSALDGSCAIVNGQVTPMPLSLVILFALGLFSSRRRR